MNYESVYRNSFECKTFHLLSVLLALPLITNFLGSVMVIFKLSSNLTSYIIYLYALVQIVYILYKYNRLLLSSVVITTLFIFFFIAFQYLIFESNRIYFQKDFTNLIIVIVVYIPSLVMVTKIRNWHQFLQYQLWYIKLTPIMILLILIISSNTEFSNYMHLSNILLPGMLGSYLWIKQSKTKLKQLLFLVYILIQLFTGSRSALIAVFIFIILVEIVSVKNIRGLLKKQVLVVSFTALVIIFNKIFLGSVYKIINIVDITTSRNLRLFLSNNFFESNSRDSIYKLAIELIRKMDLRFYGLFGDRYILNLYMNDVVYVHNIYLELILAFGLILGSIISLYLTLSIVVKIIKKTNIDYKIILIYFTCLIFIRLLVSGSFIIEGNFYLLVGVLLNRKHIHEHNIEKHNHERENT